MFIAVDGIDGSGKTTLVRQLGELLSCLNPVLSKEPTGNTHWGRKLRKSAIEGRLSKEEEVKLFHKDRLQHIKEIIRPGLQNGKIVISDRYVDSMLAFQTSTPKEADELYRKFLSEILVPDITFILVCPVKIGLDRIVRDRENLTLYEKTHTLEVARTIYESRLGKNYFQLDASGTPENTLYQAIDVLKKFSGSLRDTIKIKIKKYNLEHEGKSNNSNFRLKSSLAG